MKSHEIEYRIIGNDVQIIEIVLNPNQTIISEPDKMLYVEQGIEFDVKYGDGSEEVKGFWDTLLSAGKKLLMGENLFYTHFTNKTNENRMIAFSAPYAGRVIPIHLGSSKNNIIFCEKSAFLCASYGTQLSIQTAKRSNPKFFGPNGFVLQKNQGNDWIFVHANGTVIEKELNNQSIQVDPRSLVALESTIHFHLQPVYLGNHGLFYENNAFIAHLNGTGKIWLQSTPLNKLSPYISQCIKIYQEQETKDSK